MITINISLIGIILFFIFSSIGFYYSIANLFEIDREDRRITIYLAQLFYVFISYWCIAISLALMANIIGGKL